MLSPRQRCSSLETIKLPSSLKEILEFSFSGTGIAEVTAHWKEPITIEMESFPEDTIIRVPKEALKAYSKADGWKDYTLVKQ